MSRHEEWLGRLRTDRLIDDLWAFVNIPSPTCQEEKVARAFADRLAAAGATLDEVALDESCNVVGRLKGNRPGKILQLAGHLDHIAVAHAPPFRDGKVISGRGAADMKNGLAGILEIVRVLKESGCDFPGEILVTAYGRHEAPLGESEGLLSLIRRGIVGQAAIVAESTVAGEGKVVIQGMGQSIWSLELKRPGEPCHELNRPAEADGLLQTSLRVTERLLEWADELRTRRNAFPLLPPESFFIGQMHYGDFYNRAPTHCRWQGTRRWHPGNSFIEVQREFDDLLETISREPGVILKTDWLFVGESYRIEPDEPIVKALQAAYEREDGRPPELAGMAIVADTHRLAPIGKVPTVPLGFDNEFAHADKEIVRLDRLDRSLRLMLLTVLNYLHG